MDRYVMFTNMETMMHNGQSSTENEQKPSNHFWVSNLLSVRTWASANIDLGLVAGSASRELFIGTPRSADGRTMDAIYAVIRHWKGRSRSNTLSLAQYSTVRDLVTSGMDINQALRENFVNGIRGIKSFLIGLLDFGTQQVELTAQPLPNGKTEALCVVVDGKGWSPEGGNRNNTVLPEELHIDYVDYVFSFDLLLFYASVYLFQGMLDNLGNGMGGKISMNELRNVLRQNPHSSPHPYMNSWYDFCNRNQLADRTRPLPDPRDPGFRFQLNRTKMWELYGRVIAYDR